MRYYFRQNFIGANNLTSNNLTINKQISVCLSYRPSIFSTIVHLIDFKLCRSIVRTQGGTVFSFLNEWFSRKPQTLLFHMFLDVKKTWTWTIYSTHMPGFKKGITQLCSICYPETIEIEQSSQVQKWRVYSGIAGGKLCHCGCITQDPRKCSVNRELVQMVLSKKLKAGLTQAEQSASSAIHILNQSSQMMRASSKKPCV